MKRLVLSTVVCCFLPFVLFAEGNERGEEKYKLKTISIEADAEKDFYPSVLEDPTVTPKGHRIFTEKIGRKEIQDSGLTTANEILPFLSPSLVQTSQDKKYRNFLNSRGKSVALILDGRTVTNGSASNGGFDNRFSDSLSLEQVESIEIIKDSSTLMYGNTKGGIVHIRSRRPVNENRFAYEIGEYGKRAYTLSFGRAKEKTSYLLNFKTLDYEGPEWHNKFEKNDGIFFKFYHDFTDSDKLELTYSYNRTSFGIPVSAKTSDIVPDLVWANDRSTVKKRDKAWSYSPWNVTTANVNYDHSWNPNNTTRIQLAKIKSTSHFHNPTPFGHADGHRRIEETDSMALRHSWKRDSKILRFGYTYSHWDNPTGKLFFEDKHNEDKNHSAYIQTEIPFMNDRLVFDAGFRRDKRYVVVEDKARGAANEVAPVRDTWEEPRDNFATGLTYKINDRNTLALRGGLFEIAPSDRHATASGAALKNEKDTNIDLGYECKLKDNKTRFKLNFFKNKEEDKVVADKPAYITIDPINLIDRAVYVNRDGSTSSKGGEFSIQTSLGKYVECEIGVGKISYSPDIDSVPKKTYTFCFRSKGDVDWAWNLYGRYMGEFQGTSRIKKPAPARGNYVIPVGDFWNINFVVSHRIKNPNSKVVFAIKNILDKECETVPFAVDSGRICSVTVETLF